jgi:hypothetical protein
MDHPTLDDGVGIGKVMLSKTFPGRWRVDINPLIQGLGIATYFQAPAKSNITVPMLYCCGSSSPNGTDGTLLTHFPVIRFSGPGYHAAQKCFAAPYTN